MNRNVKDVMRCLFHSLACRKNIQVENFPNIQMFVTREEYDNIHADVIPLGTLKFGYGQLASLYCLHGQVYLMMPRQYENHAREGLTPCDDIKELWLIHIVDNNIPPTEEATEEELLMNVFTEADVENVEWLTIRKYFPEITTYKVEDKLPEAANEIKPFLKRLCLELVCLNPEILLLPYDQKTLNAFETVANLEDDNIPLDNVLRSLTSYHWKFCFIDLYRCHERLFLLAWVDEFQKTMQSQLSLQDLYMSMRRRYQTEHHEDQNIVSLYRMLPQEVLDILDGQQNVKTKSEYIYKIRNKIVHYQRTDDEIENISDEEWNKTILFLLSCIPHLYNQLATHIMELPDIC